MPSTLSSARSSVDDFLSEAEECAASENGFAAMLTAFAVIGALSEAIAGRSLPTLPLFRAFVEHMDDLITWLYSPQSTPPTRDDVAGLLARTRHALAHQLSLPSDVILVDTLANARKLRDADTQFSILGISDFIAAVGHTAHAILDTHPDAVFDPGATAGTRGTASAYVVEEPE